MNLVIPDITVLTEESPYIIEKNCSTILNRILNIGLPQINQCLRMNLYYQIQMDIATMTIIPTKFGRDNKRSESPDIIINYNNIKYYIEYTKTSPREAGNNFQYQRASKFYSAIDNPNVKLFLMVDNEDSPMDYKDNIIKNYKSLGIELIHTNPLIQARFDSIQCHSTLEEVCNALNGIKKNKKSGAIVDISITDNRIQISNIIVYKGEKNQNHDPNVGRLLMTIMNIYRKLCSSNITNISQIVLTNCLSVEDMKKINKLANGLKHLSYLFGQKNIQLIIHNNGDFKQWDTCTDEYIIAPCFSEIPDLSITNNEFHASIYEEWLRRREGMSILFTHHAGGEMGKIDFEGSKRDWEKKILKPDVVYYDGNSVEAVEAELFENREAGYKQVMRWITDYDLGVKYWKKEYFKQLPIKLSIILYSKNAVQQTDNLFPYSFIKYVLDKDGRVFDNPEYHPILL